MAFNRKLLKVNFLFTNGYQQINQDLNLPAVIFFLLFAAFSKVATAQSSSTNTRSQVVIAGKQYNASKSYQKLWGRHYRKEWTTPVTAPVLNLDTTAGGLTPVRIGGGRQTKSLHLVNSAGERYVLRSILKDISSLIPDIYKGTFVQSIANDQLSSAHPYAPLTVPPMIKAAGIYHTNPKLVFVPNDSRLGVFNKDFGNTLYYLEERPEGNQEDGPQFGHSKNVVSTDTVFQNIFLDRHYYVDQPAYVRARLFDMLLGDWDRHEGQWNWASFEQNGKTAYKPIPRDRDQVYSRFDGSMLAVLLKIAGLGFLESFDYRITNAAEYNLPNRNLDRVFTNELSRQQWIDIAKDLQRLLTDNVLEQGIRQLPPEVYPISGGEIIAKLQSRRDNLIKTAENYYNYLASKVDIPGSANKDIFEVERAANGETSVKVFAFNAHGAEPTPYYNRTFYPKETQEIRLYGLESADIFRINNENKKSIVVRIVPGPDMDSISDGGAEKGTKRIHVYDTEDSNYNTSAKVHLSNDTLVNNYYYRRFDMEKMGLTIKPGNRLGIGFRLRKEKWGKRPFGVEHTLIGYYTITRAGLALEYRMRLPELIGKWNFELGARTEFPFVVHFFGVGNNTVRTNDTNRYYRMRINEVYGGFAINRLIDSTHFFELRPYYQTIKIRNDEDKYIGKESLIPLTELERKHFAGAEAQYNFILTNHRYAPTKGINFSLTAGYSQNVKNSGRSFMRYASSIAFYLPILPNLVFATRAGGATLNGQAEFYQLNRLGGNENLRGYLRERFYGKTSFYNNNELRWLINVRSYLFNGTIGFLGFVDNGRVWQPGENSDKWHVGYGPGVVIAPFNKLWINSTYGISKDDTVFHLQVGFFF